MDGFYCVGGIRRDCGGRNSVGDGREEGGGRGIVLRRRVGIYGNY